MQGMQNVHRLNCYKAWTNELAFAAISELAPEEGIAPRKTHCRNIMQTLQRSFATGAPAICAVTWWTKVATSGQSEAMQMVCWQWANAATRTCSKT